MISEAAEVTDAAYTNADRFMSSGEGRTAEYAVQCSEAGLWVFTGPPFEFIEFVERLWRSLEYERLCLNGYENVPELPEGLRRRGRILS